MAMYGEDYDTIRMRNQSYFPAVNFGQAPGMAEGQARMNQIANQSTYKSRRAGGSILSSPGGSGSMFVPSGQVQGYLAQGYTTPPKPVDLAKEWMRGYGSPNPPPPQVVSGAGGKYLAQGGVMNPVENLSVNSPYSTFGSNLQKTFAGRLASGFFNLPGLNAATRYGQNTSTGQYGAQPVAQPASTQQGYNLYANNPSTQPRPYFNPAYNYNF